MPAIGVVFDMDGVLVASGPAHAASWRVLAQRNGRTMSDEFFRSTFGRTSRDIVRMVWGEATSDSEVKRLDDEKEHVYRDLIRGTVPLGIGARETVAALQAAGMALAIGTSGPRENADLVLDESGLRASFSAIVTGADIQRGKPAPDCFLLAAEQLDIPPARCVVVEDAPVGLEAAHAAGMGTIGLVGTHPRATLEAARAQRIVAHLGEITPDLIRGLVSRAQAG